MPLTSKTLKALISVLLPRDDAPVTRHGVNRNGDDQLLSGPVRLPSRQPTPTLETLNPDVLRLVSLQFRGKDRMALKALVRCSRTLRNYVAPVLYSGCMVYSDTGDYPPENIRYYIRQLTIMGNLDGSAAPWLETLLDCISALNAIAFDESGSITWEALKIFLVRPRILSLTFHPSVDWTHVDPYPVEEVYAITKSLSSFAYATRTWRSLANQYDRDGPTDMEKIFSREVICMSVLVPPLHASLVRLALPMECAPLAEMLSSSWPQLRELSLYGEQAKTSQPESLPPLLRSLTQFGKLSVRVFLPFGTGRLPILGQQTSNSNSTSTTLLGMRSLTLAYPDPDDDIFSIDTSQLHDLSLCDSPRYYSNFNYRGRFDEIWAAPILSSSECLKILQRLDLRHLFSLEIVYQADASGADDDLLAYVANACPNLYELELHRYRANREEPVDHAHIVEILAQAKTLRVARLNLDFHEDHGPYCDDLPARKTWRAILERARGPEILTIMEARCPLLERVDLLYHGIPTSTWAEFHPLRCAEPRFVLAEDDGQRYDIEPLPFRWWPRNHLAGLS